MGAAGEAARADGAAHHAVMEAAEPPEPPGVAPAVGATDAPESLDYREALGIARQAVDLVAGREQHTHWAQAHADIAVGAGEQHAQGSPGRMSTPWLDSWGCWSSRPRGWS